MENQVEEIKKKLDIVAVLGKYLPLKKRGRHFIANCPFHQEKTPSFTVSPELQIFKCFGCGKAGDIFTFVQEYDRCSFREALEILAPMAGIKLEASPHLTQVENQKKTLRLLNSEVARFYHYLLTSHPLGKPALDYVTNRGISQKTIKQFQIGYSPQDPLLILNYLKKKNYSIDSLIASGSFGKSQYGNRLYDRFSDRLTFPLTDYRGQVLGFSGRILPFSKNPNSAKYINSPETDIYHKSTTLFGINLAKEAIRQEGSCLVVEGEFDMISPFQSGIQNIVAIKGTAFTEDQLQLLRRYTDTLILALDSDFAGNNAARRSIELAEKMEFDIRILELDSRFKDPDEAVKSDIEYFKNQIKSAIPVWDFIINSSLKANNIETIKGKKNVLSACLPFLNKISNSVIRTDYLRKLSDALGADIHDLFDESKKYPEDNDSQPSTTKDGQAVFTESGTAPSESRVEKLEEYLLSLVLAAKNPIKLINKIIATYQFSGARFQRISSTLATIDQFEPVSFKSVLPTELQMTFDNLYLVGTSLDLDSHSRLIQINKTLGQLKITDVKDKIMKLSRIIAQLEDSNSEDLPNLELEYNQLLSRLSELQTKKG